MGLRDYYRQFEGLSEQEINRRGRAEAEERRRQALARVEQLDLAQITWPSLPHPSVVNAVTYAARRGLQRYSVAGGQELRSELAHRHSLPENRVVVGNGAAQLLGAAARELLQPGQELITPWPSYPLFPVMARRAQGRAVPVAERDADAVLDAVNEATRVVAVASPNDPTGAIWSSGMLRTLLDQLPDRVAVLLDAALAEFAGAGMQDDLRSLLEDHPRLLVFRSFSKAWGLAGLRCGYVLGGPGSEQLLAQLEPDLGINELAQVGALASLRGGEAALDRRVGALVAERELLTGELRARGLLVAESHANFLWVTHPQLDGGALSDALGRASILVAAGTALGEPGAVRITVRDRAASQRLLRALDQLEAPPS